MTATVAHRVPINDTAHAAKVSEWYGALVVKSAMASVPDFAKLPGFALAMAIVDRETATLQALAVAQNLKAIAKAGHDISRVGSISLEFERGRPVLVVSPMDLADLMMEPGK